MNEVCDVIILLLLYIILFTVGWSIVQNYIFMILLYFAALYHINRYALSSQSIQHSAINSMQFMEQSCFILFCVESAITTSSIVMYVRVRTKCKKKSITRALEALQITEHREVVHQQQRSNVNVNLNYTRKKFVAQNALRYSLHHISNGRLESACTLVSEWMHYNMHVLFNFQGF